MLDWLEGTTIAIWVQSSTWGYAISLASHGVGMAIVVGLTAVISIRLLGFVKDVPIGALHQFVPILIFGLALNTLSGVVLFMADANVLIANTAFQIKILMIVFGCILIWKLNSNVLRPASIAISMSTEFVVSKRSKIFALGAIFVWWFSVVLSGRIIAYIGL